MKQNIINTFLLLVILTPIYGCATRSEYTKIDLPKEEIKIEGLSLLPPEGREWFYKKEHSGSLIFGKLGNDKDQSVAGMAILSKLPEIKSKDEFLAIVSKQRSREPSPARFELVSNTETISDERVDFCVRFHTIQKDYGANNLPPMSGFLIVEDIGLICRHPYNKKIGVTIALSQRTKQNNKISNFKSIANEFVQNSKFIPFSPTNIEQGFALFKKHNYKEAIEKFNQAIAENPTNYSAYFYRGFSYYEQKKYSYAIADWEKTISLKIDYYEAYNNLASIYLKMKNYPKALSYVNIGIEYASSLTAEEQLRREVSIAYDMRIEINYVLKNYEQIISDYRHLARTQDKRWYIYNNLVSTIINHIPNIEKSECVVLLKEAEELVPKKYLSYVYDTYGELFFALGENNYALGYFNRAFNQSSDTKRKKEIKEKISKIKQK